MVFRGRGYCRKVIAERPTYIFQSIYVSLEQVPIFSRFDPFHTYSRIYGSQTKRLSTPVSRTTLHVPSQQLNGWSTVLLLKKQMRM